MTDGENPDYKAEDTTAGDIGKNADEWSAETRPVTISSLLLDVKEGKELDAVKSLFKVGYKDVMEDVLLIIDELGVKTSDISRAVHDGEEHLLPPALRLLREFEKMNLEDFQYQVCARAIVALYRNEREEEASKRMGTGKPQ